MLLGDLLCLTHMCTLGSVSIRIFPSSLRGVPVLSRKGGWEQVSLLHSDLQEHSSAVSLLACHFFPIFLSWLQRPFCAARGEGVQIETRWQRIPSLPGSIVLCAPKLLAGLFLWPYADLVLCFGSDRFPVGWLPVVFSLSCTDENSPFCCEGQTMHG